MNSEWIHVSTKETGFVNKNLVSAGVFWKSSEISKGISFAITQPNIYHKEAPLIAVSFVKRVMELTQLIYNY